MPRWSVVLFDFDGTLADTIPLIIASYRHTLDASGLPAETDAEMRSWIGQTLLGTFAQRYPGREQELIQTYRDWNLAHHDALIEQVAGIGEVLDDLISSGVRLGVVSSKKTETVQRGLAVVGLQDRITVLAGMDETTRHKPDPEPLRYAAARLGVDPTVCCYVGDAVVDVLAARAAAMGAVAVTWGAGERADLAAAGPEAVVDTAAELRAVLFRSG